MPLYHRDASGRTTRVGLDEIYHRDAEGNVSSVELDYDEADFSPAPPPRAAATTMARRPGETARQFYDRAEELDRATDRRAAGPAPVPSRPADYTEYAGRGGAAYFGRGAAAPMGDGRRREILASHPLGAAAIERLELEERALDALVGSGTTGGLPPETARELMRGSPAHLRRVEAMRKAPV